MREQGVRRAPAPGARSRLSKRTPHGGAPVLPPSGGGWSLCCCCTRELVNKYVALLGNNALLNFHFEEILLRPALSCRDSRDLGSFRAFLFKKRPMLEFSIPLIQYLQKIHRGLFAQAQQDSNRSRVLFSFFFFFLHLFIIIFWSAFSGYFFPSGSCVKAHLLSPFPSRSLQHPSVCLLLPLEAVPQPNNPQHSALPSTLLLH